MTYSSETFWHKTSFDHFITTSLPQLLADHLAVIDYQVASIDTYTCRVSLSLAAPAGELTVVYQPLPQPDADGFFLIDDWLGMVVPTASETDLALATIDCVGELLLQYITKNLGDPPADAPWDEALVAAWLPLDTWLWAFISDQAIRYYPRNSLAQANYLDRRCFLRRLYLPPRERIILPTDYGRVCPFEMPEGPNISRIRSLTAGAVIEERKIAIINAEPEAAISPNAALIPFLEHNDTNHLLMGVNMMRQWLIPPDPEPALVQTGLEPAVPNSWGGRNLLTAFISWGGDTHEDALVLSRSAAARLSFPHPVGRRGQLEPAGETKPLEAGDKLSNRHGYKGVVSRILPDEAMPHLADGTPVEIIVNPLALLKGQMLGPLKEAVMSRLARAEGQPAVVPPFDAPSEADLRRRLKAASLSPEGMVTLTDGKTGQALDRPSTVGWVYWGRLHHTALSKIRASTQPDLQRQGEMEYYLLRDLDTPNLLREHLYLRHPDRPGVETLAARLAAGDPISAGPPTPQLARLQAHLAVVGIEARLVDDQLACRFGPARSLDPAEAPLRLARPVPHPWLPGPDVLAGGGLATLAETTVAELLAQASAAPPTGRQWLSEIGACSALPTYAPLVTANDRLARLLDRKAPAGLVRTAYRRLLEATQRFGDELLTRDHLRFSNRVAFSGRSVIAPGATLRYDQVGLPDEMAWTLFGPLLTRELGNPEAVSAQTDQAAAVLDDLLAKSWLVVNRAPSFTETTLLAFRPRRDPGRAIRLHPLACDLLNADFDGDQVAVFLPLTAEGQQEAGEKLSLAAHLARDPGLIESFCSLEEGLLGLALLSRTEAGLAEINELAGAAVAAPDGYITRQTLIAALKGVLAREGAAPTLEKLDRLLKRGFGALQKSGLSLHPFLGHSLDRAARPAETSLTGWASYADLLADRLAAHTDPDDPDLGPPMLVVRTEAQRQRDSLQLLAGLGRLAGVPTETATAAAEPALIRHGYSEGLTAAEVFAAIAGDRAELGRLATQYQNLGHQLRQLRQTRSLHVLGRAMRAIRPGPVFARAAATGEQDPLIDPDGRLFVGLAGFEKPTA